MPNSHPIDKNFGSLFSDNTCVAAEYFLAKRTNNYLKNLHGEIEIIYEGPN